MTERLAFEDKETFLDRMKELVESGVSPDRIRIAAPHPVDEAEDLLRPGPSKLRFFSLLGSIFGFLGGFAFTIYTVKSWPLITGGKPLVSIPAFLIIAFEMTILFGALASFAGFFILSRTPDVKNMFTPEESGNQFVIFVDGESK